MSIIQKLEFVFESGEKKAIIIEEYQDKFLAMVSHEGLYGIYHYVLKENNRPKLFDTLEEIVKEYVCKWTNQKKLVQINTTNEFVKIEKLKKLFTGVEVLHV